jgi:small subunit ribosomal protein S14
MAKKSMIEKNMRRERLVERYAARRAELTGIVKDPKKSLDQKQFAQAELAKLPRNSAAIRVRNRCAITGRPRGYMSEFKLSRIKFREMASSGLLPGVKKTSW